MTLRAPLALILVALCVATPAAAQQRPDPLAMMQRADANGDGRVSLDEVRAARSELFARIDRNGDGLFTDEDRDQIRRRPMNERLDRLKQTFDQDGDGVISQEEFVGGPAPAFTMADANGDGVVDGDEMAAARDKLAQRRRENETF